MHVELQPYRSKDAELLGSLLEGVACSSVLLALGELVLWYSAHSEFGAYRVPSNRVLPVAASLLLLLPPLVGPAFAVVFRTHRFQSPSPFIIYSTVLFFALIADAAFFVVWAFTGVTADTAPYHSL